MYLAYFDEVKVSPPDRMNFFIGGIIIEDHTAMEIEERVNGIAADFFDDATLSKETELHGSHIFAGKGACKERKIDDRIQLLCDLIDVLASDAIHKHFVRIDCTAHRKKYFYPEPEYNLGLMLHIEMVERYLRNKDSLGMLFGDHERDQVENSIVSLDEFKKKKTNYYFGIKITHLIDTLYFAHSHHSRLVQLADVLMFLIQLAHYSGEHTKYSGAKAIKAFKESLILEACYRKSWP